MDRSRIKFDWLGFRFKTPEDYKTLGFLEVQSKSVAKYYLPNQLHASNNILQKY